MPDPGDDRVRRLILRLDAFVEFPGTVPLFDALSDPSCTAAQVGEVLARFPGHPLASDLGAWLADNGVVVAPPDPAAVLAALGIQDVQAWADRQKRERLALETALTEAKLERASALLSANAYSIVSVLLFFVAVLGWAAAFGAWDFQPEGKLPGPADDTPKAEVPAEEF